jgi:hypothetical protein
MASVASRGLGELGVVRAHRLHGHVVDVERPRRSQAYAWNGGTSRPGRGPAQPGGGGPQCGAVAALKVSRGPEGGRGRRRRPAG